MFSFFGTRLFCQTCQTKKCSFLLHSTFGILEHVRPPPTFPTILFSSLNILYLTNYDPECFSASRRIFTRNRNLSCNIRWPDGKCNKISIYQKFIFELQEVASGKVPVTPPWDESLELPFTGVPTYVVNEFSELNNWAPLINLLQLKPL